MTTHLLLPTALAVLALLGGCNTAPPANARLDSARSELRAAQDDPMTRERAATELSAAGDALRRADESWMREDDVAEVDHWSYVARQRVAIARETALRHASEQASKDALVDRDRSRLAARTAQADGAQREAQSAQRETALSQQAAEASKRQAAAAQARNDELETQLHELNARKTERGMVVTIGDVLFDTDAAMLRADGLRSVDKLAEFMKRYPQRSALIEGYTDSTGSAGYNQALSGRRADAVRNAIVERGVDRSRLDTQGYGAAHPVADNDSSSGRRMNRRVEIVLSDAAGAVMPR